MSNYKLNGLPGHYGSESFTEGPRTCVFLRSCPALRVAGLDMMLCLPHPSSCQLGMVEADSSQLLASPEIVPGWGELPAQSHASSWVIPCYPMLKTPGSAPIGYAEFLNKHVLKAVNIHYKSLYQTRSNGPHAPIQKVLYPVLRIWGTMKASFGVRVIANHSCGVYEVTGPAQAAPWSQRRKHIVACSGNSHTQRNSEISLKDEKAYFLKCFE